LILIGILFFQLPQFERSRRRIKKLFYNTYHLAIDFRLPPWNLPEEENLRRSGGGGVIFVGGLKKSLVQSCPYLILALGLPILHSLRRKQKTSALLLLLGVPFIFPIYYFYSAWHGAFCLNLRYLLPILPCIAILAAYTWRELRMSLDWSWHSIALGAGAVGILTILLYFFQLRPAAKTYTQQEFPYLTLPLRFALLLSLLFALHELLTAYIAKHRQNFSALRNILSIATLLSLLVAMIWAGLVEFFYDYPLIRRIRVNNWKLTQQTAEIIRGDAIIFSDYHPPFIGVQEYHRLRVASPYRDGFRDFPKLIVSFLEQGYEVYGAFEVGRWNEVQERWRKLQDRGVLEAYEMVPIAEFKPYARIIGQVVAKH
jgi:hypothetical protein